MSTLDECLAPVIARGRLLLGIKTPVPYESRQWVVPKLGDQHQYAMAATCAVVGYGDQVQSLLQQQFAQQGMTQQQKWLQQQTGNWQLTRDELSNYGVRLGEDGSRLKLTGKPENILAVLKKWTGGK